MSLFEEYVEMVRDTTLGQRLVHILKDVDEEIGIPPGLVEKLAEVGKDLSDDQLQVVAEVRPRSRTLRYNLGDAMQDLEDFHGRGVVVPAVEADAEEGAVERFLREMRSARVEGSQYPVGRLAEIRRELRDVEEQIAEMENEDEPLRRV